VPALTEDDFVVSAGNQTAHAHVLRFPDWPIGLTVITGPAKSGKTHLADIWAARAGARIITADDLSETLLSSPGPVVLEDADRRALDEVLAFNLLNQAVRGERPTLVTARAPIERWPVATEDVRSRLRLASAFDVEPLGDAHLSQMFVKLFADRQVEVEPGLVRYVLARMERSPAEVVALVDLMDRIALGKGKPITRTTAYDALAMRVEAGRRSEES
jgi:chromosomal replication initiation ATPase DnaA